MRFVPNAKKKSAMSDSMSEFVWEEPDWLKPFGLSVWHEFSGLARKLGAINLGQGFPGWAPEVSSVDLVTHQTAHDHRSS